MTSLNGRVKSLERQSRQTAGCPACGGQTVHIVEPGERLSWLDESSCCRGCGNGVKLYDRDTWDRLP